MNPTRTGPTHPLPAFIGGVVALVLSCSVDAADEPRYEIKPDESLQRAEVQACFPAPYPRTLTADHPRAGRYLSLPDSSAGHTNRESVEEIRLNSDGSEGCIRYTVHLDRLPRRWRRGAGGFRPGSSVVFSPRILLWLPNDSTIPATTRIRFFLPEGVSVSAPWEETGTASNTTEFRLGPRSPMLDSRIALGQFDVRRIELPGAGLRLAILPPASGAGQPDWLREWVGNGAHALATVYGRLPVRDTQILVVPIGRAREPVPWAQVMRGGGDAVHLYVDETRDREEFFEDWTLYHELAHLLHPLLDGGDRWLSEGLASYYQNVVQARRGLIDETEAWSNLHAGFRRGERGTPTEITLAEATENMMRDRLFMRVYWSGAAFALKADVELRRRSGGRQSLDSVLEGLDQCCLPFTGTWTGEQLAERLDRISGTDVFRTLYRRHRSSTAFPDLDETYRFLGLEAVSDTRLTLSDEARGARIRSSIMAGPES